MAYLPERDLLVLLLSKENYSLYGSYIDREYIKDQYRELHYLYTVLDKVHAAHPNDIGLQDLQAFFFQTYPDADKEVYLALFKTLSETTLTPDVGVALMKDIKARKQALILSEAAFKFSNGTGDAEKIIDAYEDFGVDDSPLDDFEFVENDIEALLDSTVRQSGLRWRLNFLNKSLGSLRKGDFGFLFARPETGKTTFLASEVSHMLTQLDKEAGPIIWFNNEEQSDKVYIRVVQAYFGITLEQLLANPRKYHEQFREAVGDQFRMLRDTNIDKKLVERVLKAYPPSLILFDQLPKVRGFAADREDLRIGATAQWARALAAEYAPAVGVFQAGGHQGRTEWLNMEDVANVTTAAQAEADWILGIGTSNREGAAYLRYLNISKNKLAGDTDSIPEMRHGRVECLIEPRVARYKDIVKFS